jgi:hypothetical protein
VNYENFDDVLEHFGVKGMKWGVRKARTSTSSKGEKEEAPKQGMSNRKKAVIGAAVVGGVVLAGAIVAHKKGVTIQSVRNSVSRKTGEAAVNGILKKTGQTKTPSLAQSALSDSQRQQISAARARMAQRSADHEKFIRDFAAERTAFNRSLNAEMRIQDNRLNVPIHQRLTLPDWNADELLRRG